MNLGESLEEFRGLHEEAKSGALGSPDMAKYYAARDEVAHLLLAEQHVGLLAGQRPRRALRVARALQADIEVDGDTVRGVTLQVSSGGFGALLTCAPRVGEEVKIALRIPGSRKLLSRARVVDVKQRLENATASFQFVDLDEPEVERMEVFVFDAILEQLAS